MTREERAKALAMSVMRPEDIWDGTIEEILAAFAEVAAEAERLGYARGWQAYADTARPKPMLDKQA